MPMDDDKKNIKQDLEYIKEKDTRNITVLAVDDSSFVLDSIKDILGTRFDLRLAKNTTHAFGILHQVQVDLILLDIDMPGMSGIEFFEYAKQFLYFKYTKVIFLTANNDEKTVSRALKLGAKGYVVKPFTPAALLDKIKEVLGVT
jgi:CheY-like chemotaxis protein